MAQGSGFVILILENIRGGTLESQAHYLFSCLIHLHTSFTLMGLCCGTFIYAGSRIQELEMWSFSCPRDMEHQLMCSGMARI
jgi:hypothetical protein